MDISKFPKIYHKDFKSLNPAKYYTGRVFEITLIETYRWHGSCYTPGYGGGEDEETYTIRAPICRSEISPKIGKNYKGIEIVNSQIYNIETQYIECASGCPQSNSKSYKIVKLCVVPNEVLTRVRSVNGSDSDGDSS